MATGSFNLLSEDLCETILAEYVGGAAADLPTVQRLATTSSSWNRLIYGQDQQNHESNQDEEGGGQPRNGFASLWSTIDLSMLPERVRRKIDDASLAAFLRRVQARENTKILVLRGCRGLEGYGLEPVRGSVVLEKLDIRFWNDRYIGRQDAIPHYNFICGIVMSMPLSVILTADNERMICGLKVLHTDRHITYTSRESIPLDDDEMQWWALRDETMEEANHLSNTFREHLASRIITEAQMVCHYCRDPIILRMLASESQSFGTECFTICFGCMEAYCAKSSCPQLRECKTCYATYCSKCIDMKKCDTTSRLHCVQCQDFRSCSKCHFTMCSCDTCFCFDRDINVYKCDNCAVTYCTECIATGFCSMCEKASCGECQGSITIEECGDCSRTVCRDCLSRQCTSCKFTCCEDCEYMIYQCEYCGKESCNGNGCDHIACGGLECIDDYGDDDDCSAFVCDGCAWRHREHCTSCERARTRRETKREKKPKKEAQSA